MFPWISGNCDAFGQPLAPGGEHRRSAGEVEAEQAGEHHGRCCRRQGGGHHDTRGACRGGGRCQLREQHDVAHSPASSAALVSSSGAGERTAGTAPKFPGRRRRCREPLEGVAVPRVGIGVVDSPRPTAAPSTVTITISAATTSSSPPASGDGVQRLDAVAHRLVQHQRLVERTRDQVGQGEADGAEERQDGRQPGGALGHRPTEQLGRPVVQAGEREERRCRPARSARPRRSTWCRAGRPPGTAGRGRRSRPGHRPRPRPAASAGRRRRTAAGSRAGPSPERASRPPHRRPPASATSTANAIADVQGLLDHAEALGAYRQPCRRSRGRR